MPTQAAHFGASFHCFHPKTRARNVNKLLTHKTSQNLHKTDHAQLQNERKKKGVARVGKE
jgi:hypothetical protein